MGSATLDARHALFPGTFDPVTLGHLDVLRRACALFARVTVAVARNPRKSELLDLERRMALLREVTSDLRGVEVAALEGLVAPGAQRLDAGVILRGARHAGDFEYEAQMARCNRLLAPGVETLILVSAPEHAHISSTLVREIAACGGPLEAFVPPAVARALARRTASP
jgi:pantetheine-phosphate adenylyltransferase